MIIVLQFGKYFKFMQFQERKFIFFAHFNESALFQFIKTVCKRQRDIGPQMKSIMRHVNNFLRKNIAYCRSALF